MIPFPKDPLKSASIAGLRYSLAEGPGITRRPAGKSFRFFRPDGRELKDPNELRRIRALVIPPAWNDVWINPNANGHLQAVGRDARGRKQYRYHPEYRKVRDQTKFSRMLAFGSALEKVRERVEQDLKLPGLPKQKVLATIVRLLETTCMRVGNDEYAKENSSYGLTTLHDKHVEISGPKLRFKFRGKSGQQQDIELSDPRIAKIVKQCRDIPGWELFQYVDSNGERCRIDSTDVNSYLKEITGEDFTAKDFRTWGGTGLAVLAFEEFGKSDSQSDAKKNVVDVIKRVAKQLGNRPATCKKYYVHPAIIDAYTTGELFQELSSCENSRRQEDCIMKLVAKYVSDLKKPAKPLTTLLRESLRKHA